MREPLAEIALAAPQRVRPPSFAKVAALLPLSAARLAPKLALLVTDLAILPAHVALGAAVSMPLDALLLAFGAPFLPLGMPLRTVTPAPARLVTPAMVAPRFLAFAAAVAARFMSAAAAVTLTGLVAAATAVAASVALGVGEGGEGSRERRRARQK